MLIGGLQKTTLIDFPSRVACTVFTVGCNFRCPFCHNKDLVSLKNFKNAGLQEISEQSFFEFLEKRKKILDGVCISGGEPTIQQDLFKVCQKIKDLGLEIKIDTNGSKPKILKGLIDKRVVDFVAMDIKTTFSGYEKVVNLKCPHFAKASRGKQNSKLMDKIKQSIKIILQSGLEYEFRTTVVPGLHDEEIMIKLAKQLKALNTKYYILNTEINWVLQQFRPKNCLDPQYLKVKPYTIQEMKDILKSVQEILPETKLRNAD